MALPPPRDHRINLTAAAQLLQQAKATLAAGSERGGMFHAQPVRDLLAQKGCAGLRIYHGRNPDGSAAMVLVGVDGDGNDMSGGTVLEHHWPCPPYCPDPDDLNP